MAKGYIFDRLLNRKIEGETNLTKASEVKTIVDSAIEADKDILSKIVVTYDEDTNLTRFRFPAGICPLSLILNTWSLFRLGPVVVDSNGEEVEGYRLDEWYSDEYESYIDFVGDISDEVVTALIYISYVGNAPFFSDTYHMFYPIRLYKHHIYDETQGYEFTIINTSAIPINFNLNNTYPKVFARISNFPLFAFYDENLTRVMYDANNGIFYSIIPDSNNELILQAYDDWDLTSTADTVTPL